MTPFLAITDPPTIESSEPQRPVCVARRSRIGRTADQGSNHKRIGRFHIAEMPTEQALLRERDMTS